MATIRERRSGVPEVRGYTGLDTKDKPARVSRTVHGTKKDAQLAAAELTVSRWVSGLGGGLPTDMSGFGKRK